jgi:hypothetical protein
MFKRLGQLAPSITKATTTTTSSNTQIRQLMGYPQPHGWQEFCDNQHAILEAERAKKQKNEEQEIRNQEMRQQNMQNDVDCVTDVILVSQIVSSVESSNANGSQPTTASTSTHSEPSYASSHTGLFSSSLSSQSSSKSSFHYDNASSYSSPSFGCDSGGGGDD